MLQNKENGQKLQALFPQTVIWHVQKYISVIDDLNNISHKLTNNVNRNK